MNVRTVGIDLDGTITRIALRNPNIRLPWWLFYILVPLVLVLRPNKLVVKKLQTIKERGCKIIIITARPIQLEGLIRKWLVSYCVPFDNLFCVGFGKGAEERKLKVINDEDVEIFIDNNKRCRDFLKNNSVNTVVNIKQLGAI